MKKFFFAVMAFVLSLSAIAAPGVLTGTDNTGNTVTVGVSKVVRYSHSAGILTYKTAPNGSVYTLSDTNGKNRDKLAANFGTNAITYNGETYNAARMTTSCPSGNSQVSYDGIAQTEFWSDGCAFWQLAVNAGLAQ